MRDEYSTLDLPRSLFLSFLVPLAGDASLSTVGPLLVRYLYARTREEQADLLTSYPELSAHSMTSYLDGIITFLTAQARNDLARMLQAERDFLERCRHQGREKTIREVWSTPVLFQRVMVIERYVFAERSEDRSRGDPPDLRETKSELSLLLHQLVEAMRLDGAFVLADLVEAEWETCPDWSEIVETEREGSFPAPWLGPLMTLAAELQEGNDRRSVDDLLRQFPQLLTEHVVSTLTNALKTCQVPDKDRHHAALSLALGVLQTGATGPANPGPRQLGDEPEKIGLVSRLHSFVAASTWSERLEICSRDPDLLSDDSVAMLERLLALPLTDDERRSRLAKYRAFVLKCRQLGMEQMRRLADLEPRTAPPSHDSPAPSPHVPDTMQPVDENTPVVDLLAALNERTGEHRRGIVDALLKKPEYTLNAILVQLLGDTDPWIRLRAIERVGALRVAEAVTGLVTQLSDPDWTVRKAAVEALQEIGGSEGREALLSAVHDPDFEVKRSAILGLGRIGGNEAVEPLASLLRDTDPRVQQAAMVALVHSGGTAATVLLVQALRDRSWAVRVLAAHGLDHLGWSPQDNTEITLYLIAKADWEGCVARGGASAPLLAESLTVIDAFDVKARIAETIGIIGAPETATTLLAQLDKPNWQVADACISALARLGDASTVKNIIRRIYESSPLDSPGVPETSLAGWGSMPRFDSSPKQNPDLYPHVPDIHPREGETAAAFYTEALARTAQLDIISVLAQINSLPFYKRDVHSTAHNSFISAFARCLSHHQELLERFSLAIYYSVDGLLYLDEAKLSVARSLLHACLNDAPKSPIYARILVKCLDAEGAWPVAADALVQMGRVSIPALLAYLSDGYPWRQFRALQTLVWLAASDPSLVHEVLDGLQCWMKELEEGAGPRIRGSRLDSDISEDLNASAFTSYVVVLNMLIEQGEAQSLDSRLEFLLGYVDHDEMKVRSAAVRALRELRHRAGMERLVSTLGDCNPEMRRLAAESLSALEWVPSDASDRARYAFALGKWDEMDRLGPPVAEALVPFLVCSHGETRITAARALERLEWVPESPALRARYLAARQEWDSCVAMGVVAIGPLLEAAADWHSRSPRAALLALNRALGIDRVADDDTGEPGPGSMDRLISSILALLESYPQAWRAVAEMRCVGNNEQSRLAGVLIEQIKPREFTDYLLVALESVQSNVRRAAAESLEILGWQPSDDVLMLVYAVAKEDWDTCVALGPRAMEKLLDIFEMVEEGDRANIAQVMGQIRSERASPILIAALEDSTLDVRQACIRALAQIGGDDVIGPLVRMLSDRSSAARLEAAEALEKLGWKAEDQQDRCRYLIARKEWEACAELGVACGDSIRWALGDEADDVRRGAVVALGQVGESSSLGELRGMLEDRDAEVIAATMHALGAIGDTTTLDWVLCALAHDDIHVQRSATQALGQFQMPESRAACRAVITNIHRHDSVRAEAARSLARLSDTESIDLLLEFLAAGSADLRNATAAALRNLGWVPPDTQARIQYLIAMNDWDGCVAIGRESVEALVAELEVRHSELSGIVEALGHIGDQRAVGPLITMLENVAHRESGPQGDDEPDRLGWRTIEALGELRDPRAIPHLLKMLEDRDGVTRWLAAMAIAELIPLDRRKYAPIVAPKLASVLKDNAQVQVGVSEAVWLAFRRADPTAAAKSMSDWQQLESLNQSALQKLESAAYDEAVELLKDALVVARRLSSRTWEGHLLWLMAAALSAKGDDIQALETIQAVRSLAPLNYRLALEEVAIHLRLGHTTEASTLLRSVEAAIEPEDYVGQAQLAAIGGDLDRAVEQVQRAITDEPGARLWLRGCALGAVRDRPELGETNHA